MHDKRTGTIFIILSIAISCLNDLITKILGTALPPFVVLFFRFFFASVSLFPLIFVSGGNVFRSEMLSRHVLRGVLGFVSFGLFIYSLRILPIAYVVMMCWTVPLFSLLLSAISLKEMISVPRLCVTVCAFLSLVICTSFDISGGTSVQICVIIPLTSAFVFAVQDVIIKKMVVQESWLTMLMYFNSIVAGLSFLPAYFCWEAPSLLQICLLAVLGIGSNLIQYFIFKAFRHADISWLAPFKYLEFVFAAMFGWVIFSEPVTLQMCLTSVILIVCSLYLIYAERRQ